MPNSAIKPALLAIIIAASVATLPLVLFEFGGDIIFHYVLIDCFNEQWRAGDMYPRWCFGANAGLGSPIWVFYAPLPYYVTLPLYALLPDTETTYLAAVWLATCISGLTAFAAMRDITTPGKALLLALLYLYLPYRLEVMLFRSAYTELWCLAFLPLVFRYTRRLVRGENATAMLALACALMFFSNMPAAMIGVLASAAYTLLMAPRRLPHYGGAVIWAGALAAIYLGPAALYRPFITTEGVIGGERTWSNNFLSMDNVTLHGQGHVVIVIGLMLLALLGLIFTAWRRRASMTEPFAQREWRVWSILALLACVLMTRASAPLWNAFPLYSLLIFPWRMQSVIMMAALYLSALRLQFLLTPRQLKTWKGDAGMLFALLIMLSLFMVSARPADFVAHGDEMQAAKFITQREYRSIWTDKTFIGMDYILGRQRYREDIPKAQVIAGKAKLDVQTGRCQHRFDAQARFKFLSAMAYFSASGSGNGAGTSYGTDAGQCPGRAIPA
jgi:uncharacterized membrane protein